MRCIRNNGRRRAGRTGGGRARWNKAHAVDFI